MYLPKYRKLSTVFDKQAVEDHARSIGLRTLPVYVGVGRAVPTLKLGSRLTPWTITLSHSSRTLSVMVEWLLRMTAPWLSTDPTPT